MLTKISAYLMAGAWIGFGLTTWLAPKGIAWYFDPPVNIGVNCREATEWSMSKLVTAQVTGIIGGLVIAAVLAGLLRRRGKTDVTPTRPV